MFHSFLFNLGLLGMLLNCFDLLGSVSTPFANNIKAVIFDCDGVLVDTEYLKFLAWKKALASKDIGLTLEEYKEVVGLSAKKILERFQEMKDLEISADVINLRNEAYEEMQALGVTPILQTIEFVHHLHQNKDLFGIKLALASSGTKNEILFNLKHIGLENIFDEVVSGHDDLGNYIDTVEKNKPKPYIYLEASKRLNIDPEHCLVFEDTEAGIEAATTAGMIAVAIPTELTKKQNFSKARIVIDAISESPVNLEE